MILSYQIFFSHDYDVAFFLTRFRSEGKMGIQEFQYFIENDTELNRNGIKGVDLVKTAWKLNKSQGQVIFDYFI